MSSHDLLEGLFDSEHEAQKIVQTARDEAHRRIEAAKIQARDIVETTRNQAYLKARAQETKTITALDSEYRKTLEEYRVQLQSTTIDYASFASECERAVHELFGEARKRP